MLKGSVTKSDNLKIGQLFKAQGNVISSLKCPITTFWPNHD